MTVATDSYRKSIEACQVCAVACEACLDKMLAQESDNDCPQCCRECADICNLCVRAMARDSKYVLQYCELCAEICDWCGEQCGVHEYTHCQHCAETCRQCANECRSVAARERQKRSR